MVSVEEGKGKEGRYQGRRGVGEKRPEKPGEEEERIRHLPHMEQRITADGENGEHVHIGILRNGSYYRSADEAQQPCRFFHETPRPVPSAPFTEPLVLM
jgi:hypothetical protein